MTAMRRPLAIPFLVFLLAWLAPPALPAGAATAAGTPEKGRSLPFNKQNVYNYFKQVEEGKRTLPDKLPPAEFQDRVCHLYASVLKQAGYDFEATIQNAVQFTDRGGDKLNDPRFLFLAGVFQAHPDVFLRLGLISKSTRDAVVNYFGQ